MNLAELQVFLTVASERSFSRAAARLYRTQPAVSQAIQRLEGDLGEQLFDRSSKDGTLTDAGRVLQEYAGRLLRLSEECQAAVRELRDLRRGRVLVGVNEGAVHALLPIVERFRRVHPQVHVDVRRAHAREIPAEVLDSSLDFGVLTFRPSDRGLHTVSIGTDDLALILPPDHPLARRRQVTMAEVGEQPIVAHNDPSPARDRVLRLYEERHAPLNIRVSLPSLDAVKRAVEMGIGVALLPRRCAIAEIGAGRLRAIPVPGVRWQRHLRLVYRRTGPLSHAAAAFLAAARASEPRKHERAN